jgi:riboflavin synthase
MFTGIVQGVAQVHAVEDLPGLRRLTLALPDGLDTGLAMGASLACDGVCLTVTARPGPDLACFDVMQQTLAVTTLGSWQVGSAVNVERAASAGAEVGGHVLSGHVDATAELLAVTQPAHNHVLRVAVPERLRRYVFAKGYMAVNGASLTMAEVAPDQAWFEVWLIPETLRMTTFGAKRPGDALNLELDRSTQVIVDTVERVLAQRRV